jgi:hypothetical protein
MTPPTFRDLTFEELLARGWQVQASSSIQRSGGIHACTLVLPNQHGGVVHAVTGQGETALEAQAKAVEVANRRRRMQAEARSRKDGRTSQ